MGQHFLCFGYIITDSIRGERLQERRSRICCGQIGQRKHIHKTEEERERERFSCDSDMINPGGTSNSFINGYLQMYEMAAAAGSSLNSSSSLGGGGSSSSAMEAHSCSLIYGFSILKDKLHQVQSLISIFASPDQSLQPDSMAVAVAAMGNFIQEVIAASSSMLYSCQQMGYGAAAAAAAGNSTSADHGNNNTGGDREQGFIYSSSGGRGESLDWYGDEYYNNNSKTTTIISCNNNNNNNNENLESKESPPTPTPTTTTKAFDIVELEADDLLAKYTHYCQICGKGFKRDANLRMHMRAHGDEYKSNAALTNPMKKINNNNNNNNGSIEMENNNEDVVDGDNNPTKLPRKYSCPQEGCRWNRKHAKFQPLKSMICVKNHYKRSHCPKMYICKRCNQKRFSVLSDLRTHEKHCGDVKWVCSCGTTFSRKDKLLGHVALFAGHTPAITTSLSKAVKFHQNCNFMN